jgi:acyl carrier protein
MDKVTQVTQAIFNAIDEVNTSLPPDRQLTKSSETTLFGRGGSLDSLGLVNFVVTTEKHLEEALHTPVSLADEKAMSQRNSPFRTVGSLVAYVCTLMEEAAHA